MTRSRPLAGLTLVLLLAGGCADPADGGSDSSAPAARAGAPSSSQAMPTAAGTPTGCPNEHGGACLGDLAAGMYRTQRFEPAIRYSVPDGWRNDEDLPGNFLLYRVNDPQAGTVGGNYMGIYQNIRAASIACAEEAQPKVGQAPDELVAWYKSVPGLVMSPPRKVTVGGLTGYQIDFSLKKDDRTCSYDQYTGIPLIIGNGVSHLHHVILHEHDVRLVILGWRTGNVTVEITNVKEQTSAADYRAQVQPILNSLAFQS